MHLLRELELPEVKKRFQKSTRAYIWILNLDFRSIKIEGVIELLTVLKYER